MERQTSRNNSGLQLGADLERRVEELARINGVAPVDVVREALDEYVARRGNGAATDEGETLFDRARRAGLIGCLNGAPPDLSTNPKYMEGFGRD
ncbi:MAG: CopG family transcriptional regulator [Planctomycetota bacterium]|jgi:predicted transcriptional regulator